MTKEYSLTLYLTNEDKITRLFPSLKKAEDIWDAIIEYQKKDRYIAIDFTKSVKEEELRISAQLLVWKNNHPLKLTHRAYLYVIKEYIEEEQC